ncbi:CPBP family glutamic-type intramembrane protease [Candidatus Berkiella aquae]|uniref:CPBP family intramembrane metalloprotease n=2 Tax=Candidatus Berkiella aquae TaxID=295108 RepID=A0AAE3HXT5_9GAMM|nr:CPBP family intramembrane glutamic endopeptidase [Candidatus Berkiella aquae]MCS5712439.1 CPBP family intramembrane metalloprotease [Candidatus Berkiella aquae]
MTLNDFSCFLLMFDRVSLAAYVMFVIMLLSFYWVKHHFLRGAIFLVFLILAWYAGRLEWIALPIVIVMGATFYYGFNGQRKIRRGLCFTLAVLFSLAMLTLRLPGIENWRVIDKMILTPDAIPYTMYLNFDKSFIGLFFIWFSVYSLANGGRWAKVLKKGCVTGLCAVLVLMPLSFALGYVKFDLKITSFFFLWAVHNLFFTCFAEEAFFRGMIQRFLQFRLQNVTYGKWISIALAAILFGAAHYPGGLRYVLLATVAGVFYGYAFMKTEKIEASIAAHFIVNTVHFVFFTYPALKSAM